MFSIYRDKRYPAAAIDCPAAIAGPNDFNFCLNGAPLSNTSDGKIYFYYFRIL